MEQQRIGPSIPPTPAAGVDPAYIPGLVPPRPGESTEKAADTPPEDAVPETASEDLPETGGPSDGPEGSDGPGSPGGSEDADGVESADEEDDGPVFEVSDRRGAIVADRSGITFRLDTEQAEFGWDEIKAVEIGTPRFGRRFGITVYTSPKRWFETDVEAPSRNELKEWAAKLDAVLDVRFDDGSEDAAAAGDSEDGSGEDSAAKGD